MSVAAALLYVRHVFAWHLVLQAFVGTSAILFLLVTPLATPNSVGYVWLTFFVATAAGTWMRDLWCYHQRRAVAGTADTRWLFAPIGAAMGLVARGTTLVLILCWMAGEDFLAHRFSVFLSIWALVEHGVALGLVEAVRVALLWRGEQTALVAALLRQPVTGVTATPPKTALEPVRYFVVHSAASPQRIELDGEEDTLV